MKSSCKVEWDLKGLLNLIYKIKGCGIENKHDLIKETHFMLKCSNQDIFYEGSDNCTEKQITKRLSQTTYYLYIYIYIFGDYDARRYTWS